MKQTQFSKSEKIGYSLLKNLPFKDRLLCFINESRLRKIKNLKTPINIVYYITNRCNARCKHCFYWKNLNKNENELNLEQLKRIAKSLKHPLHMLSITGGEPFLRKDIAEVCSIFYKINKTKRINITTNGSLTGFIVESVKRILRKNPRKRLTIFISLDGLEKINDSIRGKGSFQKAVRTIKELNSIKNKNLSVFVATTICDENYREIPELIDYVKKLNVVHKFNLLRDNSLVYDIDEKILHDFNPRFSKLPNGEELESIYKILRSNVCTISSKVEALKIRHSINMIKSKRATLKCVATLTDAVIFPEGEVSICEPVKSFLNLKETNYDFYRLWRSSKARFMKDKLRYCFCLQSCNLLNSMKYDLKTLKGVIK